MPAQHARVLLGFTNHSDTQIAAAASAVITGMTGNKAYPAPSVDLVAVQTALTDFNAAITAQAEGGPTAMADKNKKRHVLVKLLRKFAGYVQASCDEDLTTLLSSGFQAGSTRTKSPLPKPVIASVDNGHTTQLLVNVKKVANAKAYDVRSAAIGAGGAPGPWQDNSSFTSSRAMTFTGLAPGTDLHRPGARSRRHPRLNRKERMRYDPSLTVVRVTRVPGQVPV